MLLWPRLVCGGTAVPRSSPGPRLPKPYGRQPLAAPGALFVSPFNVRWRFSALAGDVEGPKLCLFSVIMPAKCVSSVSPRFHYRRLTFCFLPLAAILEKIQVLLFVCLIIAMKSIYKTSTHSKITEKDIMKAIPLIIAAKIPGNKLNQSTMKTEK
jgi:hypothetical protein